MTVIEPDLTLIKTASPTTAYLNQTITYTITIQHTGTSETPAYDLVVTDIVPSELNYVPGSFRYVSGQSPDLPLDDTGNPTLVATSTGFDDSDVSVIAFDVTFDSSFRLKHQKQSITNDASLSWTSLPDGRSGPPPIIQSDFNSLSTERFYDPGSSINIYTVGDGATIAPKLPDTGFAPGRITDLPIQNDDQLYSDMVDL